MVGGDEVGEGGGESFQKYFARVAVIQIILSMQEAEL